MMMAEGGRGALRRFPHRFTPRYFCRLHYDDNDRRRLADSLFGRRIAIGAISLEIDAERLSIEGQVKLRGLILHVFLEEF